MSSHNVSPSRVSGNDSVSANEVLKFADVLSGENKEHSAPSLGLLQLVALIRKAEAGAEDSWTPLIENELRHMKAAVRLITEKPIIAIKFGNNLEAAMKLTGILKARASELEMEHQIDEIVEDELQDHTSSSILDPASVFHTRAISSRAKASTRKLRPAAASEA